MCLVLHLIMTENTYMKEVYIELKKNVEEISRMSEELSGQMNQLEAANQAHMERMEVITIHNLVS